MVQWIDLSIDLRMKFVYTAQILFLGLLLMVSSCKKNGKTGPAPHVNTFSAFINGLTHEPNSIEVDFSGSSVPGARAAHITSIALSGRRLSVSIYHYDGTIKTYDETNSGGCYSSPTAYLGLSCSDINAGTSSEIKLISIDKEKYKTGEVVTGTFHFDTDSTNEYYNVTEGNFSVFIPNN